MGGVVPWEARECDDALRRLEAWRRLLDENPSQPTNHRSSYFHSLQLVTAVSKVRRRLASSSSCVIVVLRLRRLSPSYLEMLIKIFKLKEFFLYLNFFF